MAHELDSATRDWLERKQLPHYLPQQRWFGGKGRRIADVRVVDAGRLEPGLRLILAEVHYHYEQGAGDTYVLAMKWGEHLDQAGVNLGAALLGLIESHGGVKLEHGCVQAFATSELRPVPDDCSVKRLGGEQSNTSFRIGSRCILKLVRRLEPGPNPELEIGRFLLERTSFRRVPALAGWAEYQRPGQDAATLAMLHEYVSSDGSAWEIALRSLRAGLQHSPQPPPTESIQPEALGRALGQRTGELHLALSSRDDEPAFRPEPLSAEYLRQVQKRMHLHLEDLLASLEKEAACAELAWSGDARRVLAMRDQLVDAARPPALRAPALCIRCHGDYHLGQVLWQGLDCWIIDFEGEPTRPLAERRRKHCPVKDVAGMLRSFDYAAASAHSGQSADSESASDELKREAQAWRGSASTAFLQSYQDAVRAAPFHLPVPEFTSLLNFFLLDKALYELHYELNNRPDWVGIPLAGILNLLKMA